MDEPAEVETPLQPLPAGRNVAVVYNSRAGALLDRPEGATGLAELFTEAGLDAHFVAPEAGTLPQRIQLAIETGARTVVVAGGDGTIACAAQKLAGTDVSLGILPSGTMNLLAKDLGIPIDDVDAAIALVAAGNIRRIDVGEVGGRVFLCASMLGLPVQIGRQREAHRASGLALHRWARFAAATVRIVRRYLARRLILEFAGQSLASRAPSVTIVVNRLAETADRLFARTCLDGGEFGVYLARRPRWREIAPLTLDLLRGRWRAGGVIEERRAAALTIRARGRRIRIMNDGEQITLPLPLRYRLHPASLSVIAPPAKPPE